MFIHIIAELVKLAFKEGVEEWNKNSLRGIAYDKKTKISIIKDQLKDYFKTKDVEKKIETEKYLFPLLEKFKNDLDFSPEEINLIEDILYEIKYNSDNKKSIQKILSKF